MKYVFQKALIRALHTFWETLAGATPVGLVITVPMIREANWKDIGVAVLAWLVTAALAAVCSFIKSVAVGMPETEGKITVLAHENYDENGDPIADEFQEEVDRREGE